MRHQCCMCHAVASLCPHELQQLRASPLHPAELLPACCSIPSFPISPSSWECPQAIPCLLGTAPRPSFPLLSAPSRGWHWDSGTVSSAPSLIPYLGAPSPAPQGRCCPEPRQHSPRMHHWPWEGSRPLGDETVPGPSPAWETGPGAGGGAHLRVRASLGLYERTGSRSYLYRGVYGRAAL